MASRSRKLDDVYGEEQEASRGKRARAGDGASAFEGGICPAGSAVFPSEFDQVDKYVGMLKDPARAGHFWFGEAAGQRLVDEGVLTGPQIQQYLEGLADAADEAEVQADAAEADKKVEAYSDVLLKRVYNLLGKIQSGAPPAALVIALGYAYLSNYVEEANAAAYLCTRSLGLLGEGWIGTSCTTMGEAALAATGPLKDAIMVTLALVASAARSAASSQGAAAVGGWITGRGQILEKLRTCAAGLQEYWRRFKDSGQRAAASRHTTTATLEPYYDTSTRSTMGQAAQDYLAPLIMDLRREAAQRLPGEARPGQLTSEQETWVRRELRERTHYKPSRAGGRRTRRRKRKGRRTKKHRAKKRYSRKRYSSKRHRYSKYRKSSKRKRSRQGGRRHCTGHGRCGPGRGPQP